MSSIDSSFLHVENDVTPMHIGGVSLFEGPPPRFEDLRQMVAGKLDLVPRYRQKVRFMPLGAGVPAWVDDPHFSLDYHVRHTAIPAPGSEEQLRNMAARVFSQALDRNKPLWELWSVEGLADGRWALLSKVHHCMVDGVAATDLMSVMFSDTSVGARYEFAPAPEPSSAELLARTLAHKLGPSGQLQSLRRALQAPRETIETVAEAARAALAASSRMRPVGASSLTGAIGPHRRWAWADVRLTDVKTVRGTLGGTVNDVVLAIITNGFRELLDSRGEPPSPDDVVRTMVPVSVRRRGERGAYNNRVSAVFAALPVGLDDPRARLERIRGEMDGIKESKQAVAGDVLSSLSGFAPPLLLALGSRLVTASPRVNMHTATTNVPGPQQPVQTLGRRMLESYPFVPVVGSVRIVVAIFSYDGGLYFGITGDYDGAPDIDVLARGIERGMTDLLRIAEPPPKARKQRAVAKPRKAGKREKARKPTKA
ncbi:MAG TPA: wax ester/triacylglycerol synthase family O-acyltransferase [Solirubrobacteraceae bacterium]